MLIDLALHYGWKPAGTEDREDDPPDEGDEGDLVLSEEELEAYAVPDDHPLAQAIRSSLPQSDDPVIFAYFVSGRRVTPEDARALADALERALPDLPRHDALGHKTFQIPDLPGVPLLRVETPVNPFEWLSGSNRKELEAFLRLCRQGGFEIW
jgi:hypothetical protein